MCQRRLPLEDDRKDGSKESGMWGEKKVCMDRDYHLSQAKYVFYDS